MIFRKKNKSAHLDTGVYGEELAAKYLTRNGYKILEKNYRQRFGEIDIIATEGATLVFIEVKTRKSKQFGSGFDAVGYKKQVQLVRIATDYIQRRGLGDSSARFDVVSILLQKDKQPQIDLLQNAFEVVER